jgi:SAM-dependent methyltransferase
MYDSYAEIFAERGFSYHRAMAECPRARDAEFHAVLEPLSGRTNGLLCDLPSGGGYLAEYLPEGMCYLGVDPSHDFIDACPPGLDRIQANVTSVPLDDDAADYIVSLAALHHERDLSAVFQEMHRLLKPGGRAVIADVAADTRPAAFLNGFVDRNNPMGHEGHFLDGHLQGILEDAGLAVADDRLIETPWQFDSLEEAGEFCRKLFYMPTLDPRAVAEAMEREIGLEYANDRPHIRWVLRRVVCDAV